MAELKEYKCPACGAALRFDAPTGKLVCDNCDTTIEIESMEALDSANADAGKPFEWGDYSQYLQTDHMEESTVYICESCGAELETTDTAASIRCPYCDNEIVLTDRVTGGLKPDGIIPFRIDKQGLSDAIHAYCRGKRLLPKNFFSEAKLAEVQGVYAPFWLFDGKLEGQVSMDGVLVRNYVKGNNNCTETSYFLLQREGEMCFENVPVDASVKLDNDLMDSVEPYDFSGLKSFDGAYLAGFTADRFDSSPDKELPRAESRMMNSAVAAFTGTGSTYSQVQIHGRNLKLNNPAVKYVLLPVYLFHCEYGGKKYRYAVNGQTGKVIGELPISSSRRWAWFFGVFAAVFALIFGLGLLL